LTKSQPDERQFADAHDTRADKSQRIKGDAMVESKENGQRKDPWSQRKRAWI
jgi:hypothetical protein